MITLLKPGYSKVEQMLVNDVECGRECDLRAERKPSDEPIRAEVIAQLCRRRELDHVRVRGGVICGEVDLKEANLDGFLRFSDCFFEGLVDLTGARIAQTVEFVRCTFGRLILDRLESADDFVIRNSEISRELSLVKAEISGDLVCSGSRVGTSVFEASVNASEMRVGRTVFLDQDFSMWGTAILGSAQIGEDLNCRNAFFGSSSLSLDATHVRVEGDFIMEDVRAEGEVRVQWSHVDTFGAARACLLNRSGVALRADTLRAKSGVYLDCGFRSAGTVRMVGAEIEGEFCCTGGIFDDPGSCAIDATRIHAESIFLDHGFRAEGEVRLEGAKIGRQLVCSGGEFNNRKGYALNADGLICGGDVLLRRADIGNEIEGRIFSARGEVRMTGAEIGRELNCTGGIFRNERGYSINAPGLTTRGNVFLDEGFYAEGTVHLARATVGRQLSCSGGHFYRKGGTSLDLSGLVGHGDVQLNGSRETKKKFHATGDVLMLESSVDRDLDLSDALICGSLRAKGVTVGAALILKMREPPHGELDVSFSSVQRLRDDLKSWPDGRAVINDFLYRSIENTMDLESRLEWLSYAKGIELKNYLHLSSVYATRGDGDSARRVAVSGYRRQRENKNINGMSLLWNYFFDISVRFGYELYRPFLGFLFIGVVGTYIYGIADQNHLMDAAGLERGDEDYVHSTCPGHYPCFFPLAYSFESMTPFINMRQLNYWLPDTEQAWGKALMLYLWISIIFGWALSVAITAGVSKMFRER